MFLILCFDFVALFRPYQYLSKKFTLLQKNAYFLHIAFALILVILHMIYYIKTHESNYFELLGIKRLFTQEELDHVCQVKLQKLQDEVGLVPGTDEKITLVNQIYTILNHPTLLQLYDKYKKTDGNVEQLILNSLNITKLLQDLVEYLLVFLLLTLSTKEENLKGSRKWIAAVLTMFFSNEVNMYLGQRSHFDWFFDGYFPQFAIFDRQQMIRFAMMPCLLTIRLNFILFNKTGFLKVSDQIKLSLNNHKKISGSLRNESVQMKGILERIEDNIKKSVEEIDGQQEINSKEKKEKSCCLKFCKIFIYVMLGISLLGLFADKKFEINYQSDDSFHDLFDN